MEKKNQKAQVIASATVPLEQKLALITGPETYRKWKNVLMIADRLYVKNYFDRHIYLQVVLENLDGVIADGLTDMSEKLSGDIMTRLGANSFVGGVIESDMGTEILKLPRENPELESMFVKSRSYSWYDMIDARLYHLDKLKKRLKEIQDGNEDFLIDHFTEAG